MSTRAEINNEIRGKLRRALGKLGDTEEQVAAVLLANECYGSRVECRSCPVTVFVSRSMPEGSLVETYTDYISVKYLGVTVLYDLPAPVIEFVSSFDAAHLGLHSELDADDLVARSDPGWDDAKWASHWHELWDPMGTKEEVVA